MVPQLSRPLATLAPPGAAAVAGTAPVTAPSTTNGTAPGQGSSFAGLGDSGPEVPSDSDIAVGPTAVFEIAEPSFQIFSLTGTPLTSEAPTNTLWSGLLGPCAELSTGDWSQIIYDQLANQFVYARTVHITAGSLAEAFECLAVSQTDDPTGSWYLYSILLSSGDNAQTDYPQLGFSSDAYYLGVNLWNAPGGSGTYEGDLLVAYNRSELLAGEALQSVSAQLSNSYESFTPTTLEGQTTEPSGAPEIYLGGPSDLLIAKGGGSSSDLIGFAVTPNWTTGTLSVQGPGDLNIGQYNLDVCSALPDCGPQPGTSTQLETWTDNLMLPVVYRNFGGYQSIVGTFDVRSSSGEASPEWFELRQSGDAPWALYQKGVFSPGAQSRYDQSINEDGSGDIALAYTVSSSSIYPSIGGSVHLPTMALGTMSPEKIIWYGSASQTPSSPGLNSQASPSRWGDASYLALAPDDCTLWYSNAYYPSATSVWQTEIVSWSPPGCTPVSAGSGNSGSSGSGSGNSGSGNSGTSLVGLLAYLLSQHRR